MDKELKIFLLKLKAMRGVRSLLWLVIFVFKAVVEKAGKKFFRKHFKTVAPPKGGGDFAIPEKYSALSFLSDHIVNDLKKDSLGLFLNKMPDWTTSFNDEQDLHLLHRLREAPFMIHYCQSSLPDEHLLSLGAIVRDWIQKNSQGSLPGWHPYTLSERIIHLSWMLHFLRDKNILGKDDSIDLVKKSVLEQAAFLSANFEFHLGHHNHLINNARALLVVAVLFPDHHRSKEWKQMAVEVFKKEWAHQLLPDGVHAEQSLTYHFLLTRSLWEMKMLFRQAGESFPFDEDLTKMVFYARNMVRPDGTIPLLGHITPDWYWGELVGLLPVWGYPVVKTSSLGKLYKPESVPTPVLKDSASGILVFPSAGQGIIKGSHVHVVLSCDPRGTLTTHGDQNQLGIDIWLKGTHVIRDAGLDSYNTNASRKWFESWEGQSTFVIDSLEPVVSTWRKRQLPENYYTSTGSLTADDQQCLIRASHTGYHRLPDPVTVERSVMLKEDVIMIEDKATGRTSHEYTAVFHFGSNIVVETKDNSLELLDTNKNQRFLLAWKDVALMHVVEKSYAEAYGKKKSGNTAFFKTAFRGNLKVEYTIAPR